MAKNQSGELFKVVDDAPWQSIVGYALFYATLSALSVFAFGPMFGSVIGCYFLLTFALPDWLRWRALRTFDKEQIPFERSGHLKTLGHVFDLFSHSYSSPKHIGESVRHQIIGRIVEIGTGRRSFDLKFQDEDKDLESVGEIQYDAIECLSTFRGVKIYVLLVTKRIGQMDHFNSVALLCPPLRTRVHHRLRSRAPFTTPLIWIPFIFEQSYCLESWRTFELGDKDYEEITMILRGLVRETTLTYLQCLKEHEIDVADIDNRIGNMSQIVISGSGNSLTGVVLGGQNKVSVSKVAT